MTRVVKKPEERRRELISAARELYEAGSYKQVTMQDLMDKLGIAKGTIYHYFPSREALFEAVVEDIIEEDLERRRALVAEAPGTALEKLRALLTAGSLADQHPGILDDLHDAANVGMHTRLLAVAVERQAVLIGRLIRQGCDEGVFHTDHPRECAEFLLAGTQFLTDTGLHPWAPEDLMRRARALPSLIEAQLKAPDGSFGFLAERLS